MELLKRNHTNQLTALIMAGCLWLVCTLNAAGQNINRQMVNRLLSQLKNSRADTSQLSTLLELGKFHIYKAGEIKADLDSARFYLDQAKKLGDSLHLSARLHQIESLSIIADMEGRDAASGKARFAQLIDNCRRTGDKESEAIARSGMGVWLRNVDNNYHIVFANFRRAASLYRDLKKPKEETDMVKEIAITYLYEGKVDSAQRELMTALARYKAIGYPKLHYTYNLLAEVSRLKGDLDKSLLYGMLCIDSMNKTADTLSQAVFFGDLAGTYQEIGNHSKATEWYKKTLDKWQQEGLPNFSMYNAAGFIIQNLIDQKKPYEALTLIKNLVQKIPTNTIIQKACVAHNLALCYDALQNHALAEQYYLETLGWYKKNGMDFETSQQAEEEIGTFYFNRKNLKKAGDHLRKALSFYPQKNALSTVSTIHFMLFRVDSAQGNYLAAIQHFRQHKTLNDSLFDEKKSKQISQLQIQYDTRKKEQDIALLTRQSKLQQSELTREHTTRNSIIAGSMLLAGLLGVSYNRYRLKKRSNQLLEAQQVEINQKNQSLQQVLNEKDGLLLEKEWMLKEIHHRVKNNLQIVSSMLNAQLEFISDPAVLSAIRESQNRVHAMALIHQKLYQSNSLAHVNMAGYIQDIVDYLIESFDRYHSVRQELTVSVPELDVTLATPLGLIINEAVTNSLKYAFPHNRPGLITIDLNEIGEQTYLLTITDDGIGLPPGFDVTQSNTLGLTMIRGLSRQVGGHVQINQQQGIRISLQFSMLKSSRNV